LIEEEKMTKGDILKLAKQRRDEKQAEERNGNTGDQSLDDLLSKYQ
jgi:hypothetical protein